MKEAGYIDSEDEAEEEEEFAEHGDRWEQPENYGEEEESEAVGEEEDGEDTRGQYWWEW